MKACFVDNRDIPVTCDWDIDRREDCLLAVRGISRSKCQYWRPDLARDLCREILKDSGWEVRQICS